MTPIDLGIDPKKIADFCQKWKISILSAFGSIVRGELQPESDIDLLVTFSENADWTMFDHFNMEEELTHILGHEVDLVNIKALEENQNPIYKQEILSSARQIYAAESVLISLNGLEKKKNT
ncbi:MAG: nucleotidyltransferase family protein [Sedimentisphaerales bacterium]|nr:nucleotidyltransferase family protein [Sedimentisphaerales bacterium]